MSLYPAAMTVTVRGVATRVRPIIRALVAAILRARLSQQLLIHGQAAACHLLKRNAIKFEHDRIAHRNDGRGAQSAGKERDFTDWLAYADFRQGNRLSFNPDFKSPGSNDKNCIGYGVSKTSVSPLINWRTFTCDHISARCSGDSSLKADDVGATLGNTESNVVMTVWS